MQIEENIEDKLTSINKLKTFLENYTGLEINIVTNITYPNIGGLHYEFNVKIDDNSDKSLCINCRIGNETYGGDILKYKIHFKDNFLNTPDFSVENYIFTTADNHLNYESLYDGLKYILHFYNEYFPNQNVSSYVLK